MQAVCDAQLHRKTTKMTQCDIIPITIEVAEMSLLLQFHNSLRQKSIP